MRALAFVVVLAVAGCATTYPGPAQQYVRFTNGREMLRGCTSLGIIDSNVRTSGGTVGTVYQMPVDETAFRRLRGEATRLGANFVLVSEIPTGMSIGGQVGGEAFRCPSTSE